MTAGLLAHGVGARTDLPLDTATAVTGAVMAVLISIVAVNVLRPATREVAEPGRPVPHAVQRLVDAPALRLVLRVVVLAAALFVTVVALAGPAVPALNLAPWALYLTFWVSIVPVSLVLGPVWRAVNPLRTLHAAVERLAGLGSLAGTRPLPAALGWWPAAAWLALFVWLELVHPDADEPRLVGTFLVTYGLTTLVLALVFGRGWFDRGDGFQACSTLIGRLSPFGRREDGRLVVRSPLEGLHRLRDEPGLVAVAVVLMGSTAFDGLTRTRPWQEEVDPSSIPLGTLGLASMIGATALLHLAGTAVAGRLVREEPLPAAVARVPVAVGAGGPDPDPAPPRAAGRPDPRRRLPGLFAASLVPIAVGYAVAHYASLLLLEGQTTWILASDPFRTGADLFDTAARQIDYRAISPAAIA